MDNAPGYFPAFERNNIEVVFFSPNCASWKQPCDMGIIAARKKRYEYLYLKDVLNFCELDENLKARKKEQAKRLPRGAEDVAYGNPAQMLDAAEGLFALTRTAFFSVASTNLTLFEQFHCCLSRNQTNSKFLI